MEMNRYLIAALYVMAGCVVAVPLKVQGNTEPLRGERCRLVITNTVKIISVCLDNREVEQVFCDLSANYYSYPKAYYNNIDFPFNGPDPLIIGFLCPTSHKIRAPGECKA